MSMNFTISAPGKIILAGEHAVVYGYKAIASSINLRCQARVSVSNIDDNLVTLDLSNIPFKFSMNECEFTNMKESVKAYNGKPISGAYQDILSEFLENRIRTNEKDEDFIKSGIMVFIDLYFQLITEFMPMDISITSEFSYGCGLGSSAAYSTVLATSLLLLSGDIPSNYVKSNCVFEELHLNLISNFAFRGEQIVHGTPSGIDNSISTFGKGIVFQRLSGSMVKRIFPIPNLRILIVDTNIKRCTKTVVKHVNKLLQVQPQMYYHLFNEIHEITESIEKLIMDNTENVIADINCLIEENQRLLRLLGVSHSSIEEIITILKVYGISAKLTGAGWGGCVYGIVNDIPGDTLDEGINHLASRGYGTYLTSLSCPGVKVVL